MLLVVVLALSIFVARALAGSEHHGQVTFNGLPVPGATVTATQGEKKLVAITDQQGMYSFASLDDGAWKFEVEMLGFATQTQDITIAADTPSTVWELKILTLAQIAPGLPPPGAASAPTASAATAASANGSAAAAAAAQAAAKPTKGFQRAAVNSSSNAPAPAADSSQNSSEAAGSVDQRAATGLLVNGSVNNGAASAFSQMAAFGNNRRGPGSLYNGGVLVTFDTSGWDAAAFPLGGVFAPKPSYNDLEIAGAVGGPIGFRHHLIAGSNFFVAYQHVASDDSSVLPGSVPTVLERGGN